MTAVESILGTIRRLSGGEVDELLKRVSAFRMLGAWGDSKPEDDAERVFRVLVEEFRLAGLGEDFRWHRLPNKTDFSRKASKLVEFTRQQHEMRLAQDALLRLGAQLLIRHFRHIAGGQVALSVPLLAANVHRVASLFDREFPGYASSRILGRLIGRGRLDDKEGR